MSFDIKQIYYKDNKILWNRILLSGILLFSAFLYLFNLKQVGFGNIYYAAGVRSMSQNWHSFFFNSFDSAGFVTIDKPPFGFWIQAISVRIFGYNGFALLFPQALAGTLSVLFLYKIVAKYHGPAAGLISAFMLSTTPIFTALSRNNTIDMLLIFSLILAAWFILKACESKPFLNLAIAYIIIGIGFNIKMLQAYMVIPAFYLVYFFYARQKWPVRILHLFIATVILIIVSFSWVLTVDMLPENSRPYIGGSQTNKALELVFGHNGIRRIINLGRGGSIQQPQTAVAQGGPGGQFTWETGTAGIMRLFNYQLAGQISWLLPFVFFGFLLFFKKSKQKLFFDKSIIFWLAWIIPMALFMSFTSGLFHRYYVAMMAPGIAALSGILLTIGWKNYREQTWHTWFLPIILTVTLLLQIIIQSYYWPWFGWTVFIVLVLSLIIIGLIIYPKLKDQFQNQFLSLFTLCLIVFSLSFFQAIWSINVSFKKNINVVQPNAGPASLDKNNRGQAGFGSGGIPAPGQGNRQSFSKLEEYLLSEFNGEKFIVATQSAKEGGQIIVNTGKPVMAMGGFSGNDPILNKEKLAEMVTNGELRFVLIGQKGGRGGRQRQFQPQPGSGQTPGNNLAGQNQRTQDRQRQNQQNFPNRPTRQQPANRQPGLPNQRMNRGNNELITWIQQNAEIVNFDYLSGQGPRPGPVLYDLKNL